MIRAASKTLKVVNSASAMVLRAMSVTKDEAKKEKSGAAIMAEGFCTKRRFVRHYESKSTWCAIISLRSSLSSNMTNCPRVVHRDLGRLFVCGNEPDESTEMWTVHPGLRRRQSDMSNIDFFSYDVFRA